MIQHPETSSFKFHFFCPDKSLNIQQSHFFLMNI